MAKTSKIPSGFYTGREAANRLGMPLTTFYHQVKTGKIEKIVPPGGREGYFQKETIEKMAQAKELFTLLYSVEPVVFSRAETEDDVRGIVDLCVAIYGVGGTPNYDTRLSIWRKNPEVYYVLKQESIVVGYVSLIWFNDVALEALMGQKKPNNITNGAGSGVYSVTGPENMLPFVPGKPIDSLFISLATRPGMTQKQQSSYGLQLIRDTMMVVANFFHRGMPVRKLLATSERQDGIRIARKLGMREIRYPNDPLLRYELDLDENETHVVKILKRYT